MKITVTVNEDGTTDVDVEGVQGPDCKTYTDAVLKALGGKLLDETKKPEFSQPAASKSSQKLGG